jgi:hypothetical protein
MLPICLVGGCVFWERHEVQAPREMFRGITYGCHWLEATEEGGGLLPEIMRSFPAGLR